jgi:hypothetical protein
MWTIKNHAKGTAAEWAIVCVDCKRRIAEGLQPGGLTRRRDIPEERPAPSPVHGEKTTAAMNVASLSVVSGLAGGEQSRPAVAPYELL